MAKHRQLARQVGVFGENAIKSSTDLDNMIFPAGSTFVSGSWVCEAGGDGKLRSYLLENSATSTDKLAEKVTQLRVSDSVQATGQVDFDSENDSHPSLFPFGLRNAARIYQNYKSGVDTGDNSTSHLSTSPIGLNNSATTFQGQLEKQVDFVRRIPLTGVQKGLVMIVTPYKCIIHWPSTAPGKELWQNLLNYRAHLHLSSSQ